MSSVSLMPARPPYVRFEQRTEEDRNATIDSGGGSGVSPRVNQTWVMKWVFSSHVAILMEYGSLAMPDASPATRQWLMR